MLEAEDYFKEMEYNYDPEQFYELFWENHLWCEEFTKHGVRHSTNPKTIGHCCHLSEIMQKIFSLVIELPEESLVGQLGLLFIEIEEH